VAKRPNTWAGVRTVALPMWLVPELLQHFGLDSEREGEGRAFAGPYEGPTAGRRRTFSPDVPAIISAEDVQR
jgi:hypothetical protein